MKKTTIGALALVVGIMASAGMVSAYGFENKEAVREAIETGDFAGWKETMQAGLTEENFARMQEKFQNREEHMGLMREHREAINQGLESGDYDTWFEAIEEMKASRRGVTEITLTEIITEENFARYIEFHEAMQEKDYETATEIAEELGLEPKGPMGGMGGRGFRVGSGSCPLNQ